MPGEMTHWLVLEEATARLQNDSPELARIISENKSAARLGAMIHDAAYYYKLGGKPPEAMAALLHGSFENNTFEPLVKLAGCIQKQEKKDILWATLFGMVSHFATDIEFHPFVYFQTGDYYDSDPSERKNARRRHRLLEVYIDSWFKKELREKFGSQCCQSMARDYFRLSGRRREIVEMLEEVLSFGNFAELAGEVEESWQRRKFWGESLAYLVFCQGAFESLAGGMLLRGLRKLWPERVGEIDALGSWGRGVAGVLEGEHRFLNPVSGVERKETLEGLKELAVQRTVDVVSLFLPGVLDERVDCLGLLEGVEGVSLNFGVSGTGKKSARYFSEFGLIEGLEKLG